jgi:hypothetical protein
MRPRIVPELDHLRMAIEQRLHLTALDAAATAVDDSHLPEAGARRGTHVFIDDRCDIARGERMEIDLRLDRQVMRIHEIKN